MNDDLYEPEHGHECYDHNHPAPEDSPFGCMVMLLLLGLFVGGLVVIGANLPPARKLPSPNPVTKTLNQGAL